MVVIVLNNERELLLEFVAMYTSSNPSCHIHFNGTSFDIPYMKARMRYNDIVVPSWLTGGVDIYRWYRKNRPGWASYSLDSIASRRLGRGKVPMPIREMFAIMRTNIGTERLVQYSIMDTLLLVELVEKDHIL
jgi:DNA polymerase elongation subunit (family B)